ncbi:SRPBCC domain-containing protein [bacterium]|nr:SRPBCC domain-containing protein [bacterium]
MPIPFSYDWTRFVLRIEIAASPARVFRAWTESDEVQAWFPEKAESEPKKGGRYYLEFLGGDIADMKFLEFRKPNKVVFTFGDKGETVTVRIRKAGKKTICELEQSGMSTSPKSRVHMHMGCKTGWVFFLTNLKAYLEHGIDLRSHDRRKTYNQSYVNS